MDKQRGFNIIELMITIAIAGIVLAVGVPSFRQFVNENKTATEVNNLITALNLARGEAITRGVDVDVIPIVPGDWTQGWGVGIDIDNNGAFTDTGDELIRVFDGIDYGTFGPPSGTVEFRSTGEARNKRTFTLTPTDCEGNQQRQITVGASGHVDMELVACP